MTQILIKSKDTFKLSYLTKYFQSKEGKSNLNVKEMLKSILLPLFMVLVFIGIWHLGAGYLYNVEAQSKINKALNDQGATAAAEMESCILSGDVSCQPNTLPSPSKVYAALLSLIADHKLIAADKAEFKTKMASVNNERVSQGLDKIHYTGRPSFVDQIWTSLITVFAGFFLAMLIAVPIGIVMGLSKTLRGSINWLIQILKPVSPVVWLLLVFMIVKTLTINQDGDTSFTISFISVGLCAMWPTLVNTNLGVSTVNKDYINVAKVMQLKIFQKIFKIILPSAIPLIFTGLRITLSVAWMVLIAIELLAQSPGLGSFVWEEFQNGANDSNAKIIVAMVVIGVIGFLLDRMMLIIQKAVSFEHSNA